MNGPILPDNRPKEGTMSYNPKKQLTANLAKLPAHCYGTNASTGETILIKCGTTGYWQAHTIKTAREMNEKLGVTEAQEMAMEVGSIFGFDVPGANPDLYI